MLLLCRLMSVLTLIFILLRRKLEGGVRTDYQTPNEQFSDIIIIKMTKKFDESNGFFFFSCSISNLEKHMEILLQHCLL